MSETQMDPAAATAMVHAAVPAAGLLGIEVAEVGPGLVVLTMPLNPNHLGTMYAGAMAAMAELPGGILPLTVVPGRVAPIVTDLSMTFVKAARSAVTLNARMDPAELERLAAEAENVGRAEFVLDLEVKDADDVVVATSHGVYQLRPPRT